MEAKIKQQIEELTKLQQQRQQELQAMRNHISQLEADIIARSGAIQVLRQLIEPEKKETPAVPGK
jgi:DNA-binding protein YbaB